MQLVNLIHEFTTDDKLTFDTSVILYSFVIDQHDGNAKYLDMFKDGTVLYTEFEGTKQIRKSNKTKEHVLTLVSSTK